MKGGGGRSTTTIEPCGGGDGGRGGAIQSALEGAEPKRGRETRIKALIHNTAVAVAIVCLLLVSFSGSSLQQCRHQANSQRNMSRDEAFQKMFECTEC